MPLPDDVIPGGQAFEIQARSSTKLQADQGSTEQTDQQSEEQLKPQQDIKSVQCELFPLNDYYRVRLKGNVRYSLHVQCAVSGRGPHEGTDVSAHLRCYIRVYGRENSDAVLYILSYGGNAVQALDGARM